MKALITMMLILASIFASTFLLLKLTGILTFENLETWFNQVKLINPALIMLLVIALLFADLFIAVPTLTVMILAGFFLGFPFAAISVFTGLLMAAMCGYFLSRQYGEKLFSFIVRNSNERKEAATTFNQHGIVMVLLSRAMPILPEVTACMAGITRMPKKTFFSAWVISTLPYCIIATYAGSISSINNPLPAIYTGLGLTTFLWLAWAGYRHIVRRKHNNSKLSLKSTL